MQGKKVGNCSGRVDIGLNKDSKAAIINMLKEWKETTFKELEVIMMHFIK